MASEGAQRLLEDLYLAWLVSVGAAHDPTKASDNLVAHEYLKLQKAAANASLGMLVRLLWNARSRIDDGADNETGVGFSTEARALWCKSADLNTVLGITRHPRTHELQKEVKGKRRFEIFRERRPFARMSAQLAEASFWPRLAAGEMIDPTTDAHVIYDLVALASTELQREVTKVRLPGLPIGGVIDATIWIGFRTEQQLRDALKESDPELSNEPLGALLRHQLTQALRASILTSSSGKERDARRPTARKAAINTTTPPPEVRFEENSLFAVIDCSDDERLARALLDKGFSAQTGDLLHGIINRLVAESVAEYKQLPRKKVSLRDRAGTEAERAFALRLAHVVDKLFRTVRSKDHADTTRRLSDTQERYVRRYHWLEPKLQHLIVRGTFWPALIHLAQANRSSAVAWNALFADDESEFRTRLNAGIRRVIFQDCTPLHDTLLRPEIAHYPQNEGEYLASIEDGINEGVVRTVLNAPSYPDDVGDAEYHAQTERLLSKVFVIIGNEGSGVRTSLYQLARGIYHRESTAIFLWPELLEDGDVWRDEKANLLAAIKRLRAERSGGENRELERGNHIVVMGHCCCMSDAEVRTLIIRLSTLRSRLDDGNGVRFVIGVRGIRSRPLVPPPETDDVRPRVFQHLGRGYVLSLTKHLVRLLGVDAEDDAIEMWASTHDKLERPQDVIDMLLNLPANRISIEEMVAEGEERDDDAADRETIGSEFRHLMK
jgi:hypothetical protein